MKINFCRWTLIRHYATFNIERATSSAGFPLDKIKVTTTDGYKLTLHRLRNPRKGDDQLRHETPILLQHGMWSSSENWVVQGPNSALGYVLSKAGFDVWLGNTRGNVHSREHLKISPQKVEYWDFSVHEMGVFDLPAMIDKILEETGRSQLYFVGHSQGTTAFFVMTSELVEYNAKVRAAIALAPVAFLNNMKNRIFQAASYFTDPILGALRTVGVHKLFPDTDVVAKVDNVWKTHPKLPTFLAEVFLSELSGYATEEVRSNAREVVLSHVSSGTSAKGLAHFGQLVRTDFRHFDYGPEKNRLLYGSETPPPYHLINVTSPVIAFYSDGDWLSSSADVMQLVSKLGGPVYLERISDSRFNHQDFIWADLVKFEIIHKLFRYLFYFGKI